ncbi:hypothetical protein I6F34_01295 [Bradyrhizobium sp. BRP05]|nr:hypothetical protein [Bradyrhizobium sp. BRP05]
MKLHALGASAVALALVFTTPASALSDNVRSFTIAATSALAIAVGCDGYTVVEGALPKLADRNGVSEEQAQAILAAMLAQAGHDYDRSDLIPEITVVVRDTVHQAFRMLDGRDRADMCGKVANSAVEAGFIRRK